MSPAPLQMASLIKAGMSSRPSMEAGTTDWQGWGIGVARLDISTLIFCATIGETDNDPRRIRLHRLFLQFSRIVSSRGLEERLSKVTRSISSRPGFCDRNRDSTNGSVRHNSGAL